MDKNCVQVVDKSMVVHKLMVVRSGFGGFGRVIRFVYCLYTGACG